MTPLPKSRRSTVSDTDTSKPEHLISPPLPAARIQTRRRARRRAFPLTVRILAVNILALGILLAGLLYLDRYQRDLMDAKLNAMEREATLLASALGEGLVSQRQVRRPHRRCWTTGVPHSTRRTTLHRGQRGWHTAMSRGSMSEASMAKE